MRLLLPFVMVLGLGTVALPARATPTFPDVIKDKLDLTTAPACSLCHAGPEARGTVTTPFGITIRSRGAQAYDEESLRHAIDAISAEKKDSDGDGISDVDELKAGTDPNAAAGQLRITPEYGCGATPVRGGGSSASAMLLLVMATVFVRRARRS